MLRIAASRDFFELIQNWIRSSHGHSAPSLKISCKSVQPFSRNLANKETNKERKIHINKQRNRSKTIPCPSMYRGRGTNRSDVLLDDRSRSYCIRTLYDRRRKITCVLTVFSSGVKISEDSSVFGIYFASYAPPGLHSRIPRILTTLMYHPSAVHSLFS